MNFTRRLARLEEQSAKAAARQGPKRPTPTERIAEIEAYLRGEGPRPPDPPCPSHRCPEEWAKLMREGRQVDAWLLGEMPLGEYLPELDEAERRNADNFWQMINHVAAMQAAWADGLDHEDASPL